MNVLLRKSLYQTNILPAMIAEIIEKNKNLLQSTGSYLVPGIDLIIGLMRVVENSAGDALFNAIHPIAFSKGDYLLREGTPCKHITILETGIARQFINKNGSEPSASFFFPGEFIASYKKLIINTTSKVNIQFVTNATGYSISLANIEKLNPVYPMLAEIERRSFELRSYWLYDRFYQLTFSTARERYQNLLDWPPDLLQQISITNIAYYLGVTLETLSRLRGEINFH